MIGALDACEAFRALSSRAASILEEHVEPRVVCAGEVLTHQGTFETFFTLVLDGVVGVLARDGRREVVAKTFGPGAWLGVLSLLSGAPAPFTSVALTPATLLQWPQTAFRLVYERPGRNEFRDAIDRDYGRRATEVYLGRLLGSVATEVSDRADLLILPTATPVAPALGADPALFLLVAGLVQGAGRVMRAPPVSLLTGVDAFLGRPAGRLPAWRTMARTEIVRLDGRGIDAATRLLIAGRIGRRFARSTPF